LKLKELYSAVIFNTILGAIVPSFGGYIYYYQIDVVGFTFTQYSLLSLIGYATLISGSIFFNLFMKNKEFTMMMIVACFINCLGSITTVLFTRGIYLGMSPYVFVILTSTVTDTLYQCFVQLPLMVLFAKLIPEKIEASLFAFLTGLSNLNNLFIASNLGNLINLWVGANEDNLATTVWKLYAIQAGMSLLPLFFIWLIPKRQQVEKVQRCFEYIDLYSDRLANKANKQDDYEKLSPRTAGRIGIKNPADEEPVSAATTSDLTLGNTADV
jgi:hypothetical protein